jgi:hypothetical protein
MVASVSVLTFHFPVPGSLLDSFSLYIYLSPPFIAWTLFNFFVCFQPKMKIHSQPLNYLSAPTVPVDSAAVQTVKVIVYLPG